MSDGRVPAPRPETYRPIELTRVRFDVPHFTISERPEGVFVNAVKDSIGVAMATTHDLVHAVVQCKQMTPGGEVMVVFLAPWEKLVIEPFLPPGAVRSDPPPFATPPD